MVAYLRDLLLLQAAGPEMVVDGTADQREMMLAQAQRPPRQALIDAVKRFNEAALTPTSSWQPQLPLELAFIELLPAEAAPPAAQTPAPSAAKVLPKREPEPKQEQEPEPEPELVKAAPPPKKAKSSKPVSQEQSPPATGPTPPATFSLTAVSRCWPEMEELVGSSQRNLPPLLNMSKPLALEGNVIILGFEFPLFKDKFDKYKGAAQLVGEVFSHLLQTHCTVRAVVTSDYTVPIQKEEFTALADELGGVVSGER